MVLQPDLPVELVEHLVCPVSRFPVARTECVQLTHSSELERESLHRETRERLAWLSASIAHSSL